MMDLRDTIIKLEPRRSKGNDRSSSGMHSAAKQYPLNGFVFRDVFCCSNKPAQNGSDSSHWLFEVPFWHPIGFVSGSMAL